MRQSEKINSIRLFERLLPTNSSDAAYAAITPTVTDPLLTATKGCIDLTGGNATSLMGGGSPAVRRCMFIPFGLSANNDAFTMRVYGWKRAIPLKTDATSTVLWVPTLILKDVTCTMGAMTGVAGAAVLDTESFCDTVVPGNPIATYWAAKGRDATPADTIQGQYQFFSPADDTIGMFEVPTAGFERLQATFKQSTNSPAMNALYALFGEV